MSTIIQTRIIKIGNSQGIRIPRLLLEQTSLGDEVELELAHKQIIIRPRKSPRQDWEAAFQAMAELGDDELIDNNDVKTEWEEEEWDW